MPKRSLPVNSVRLVAPGESEASGADRVFFACDARGNGESIAGRITDFKTARFFGRFARFNRLMERSARVFELDRFLNSTVMNGLADR